MKKTRLLFILYDRPNYPGGPIINYLRVLPALVNRGYDVHVLVMYHLDCPNARSLQERKVITHNTPFIVDSKQAVKWILKQIEAIQPDVFIPDVSTPGCFAGKWVKAAGIPVINSHRSDDENNWGKALYFSDPGSEFVSSAIFCVSEYLRSQLETRVRNLDLLTAVIPSGVSIPVRYNLQDGSVSVVYVGRLIQRQKRILDITRIFVDLAQRFAEVTFAFIGDGPDKKACEEIVSSSGYAHRFRFTGMLKDDIYKQELSKHNIVVLLSEYEGVPGSLMDSMASGLVPVCSRYPGIEELVLDGETGILVHDRKEAVVAAVSMLVLDPGLRKRISQNARRHIIEKFSLENTLDKWEDLIRFLVEQYREKKSIFVSPNDIELPSMNDVLKEHIMKKPAPFHWLYSHIPMGLKAFLKRLINKDLNISSDNFLDVPFIETNLDKYVMRTSIKRSLDYALPNLHGRLLDAGCGKMPYREYILKNAAVQEYVGLDIENALIYDENIKPDSTWDGRVMPFDDNSFDSSIAIEVLEHCPEPEVFLKEVYRVLKPNSTLFFTVPFLWNLHEVPHDEYRYTPFALERHLRNSGFEDIVIKATGGWHASLAQMLGLWVRRAPMRPVLRKYLSPLIKPIIGWLIKKDAMYSVVFSESQMVTGLYGLAKKNVS
ncbi:MAG: glycosyltransferase [Anaerolineales bacterium]|jgi:glycosyltransferase involved in cell wall biosynthesis/SAM-dependent methyltransferase|nr:glycosyltransferase [Anaerolineales bacterium]